jgi:hypothetical protein
MFNLASGVLASGAAGYRGDRRRVDSLRSVGPAEPEPVVRVFEALATRVVRFRLLIIASWIAALAAAMVAPRLPARAAPRRAPHEIAA